MLVAAPVLLVWVAAYRRRIAGPVALWAHRVLLGALAITVALDHADNEVMRFMGTHLTVSLARTYGRLGSWGADVRYSLLGDRGGPGLPLLILVGGPLLLCWVGTRLSRRSALPRAGPLQLGFAVLALAVPLLAYQNPHGRFRRARVQPEIFTLFQEIGAKAAAGTPPTDLTGVVRRYREGWARGDPNDQWVFSADSSYPFLRRPRVPAETARDSLPAWNVIYLQLETFRGWDVGFLRPDRPTSPTPFLDSLAAAPGSAYWTRALSFGPPTVSGFIAGHCSIQPHSRQDITTTFTFTQLDCVPAVLRRWGWHTAFFTGTDPDWDNETPWLDRWYDERHFYREARENDRAVFQAAATRIRELGRSGSRFFATVASISNHYPFRSREPALDLSASSDPRDAIRNTMHYTDAVLREFLGSLAAEPWFDHTLIVVVGDHGYNLGEHAAPAGLRTGWRESLWIPLLIHGAHPGLPRGPHGEVASLLDVAPTLADLLGIREATAWQGHSLLTPGAADRVVASRRVDMAFAESDRFSLVLDPVSGRPHLYESGLDPLQQHDVAAVHPEVVAALARRAAEDQSLTDFLLEADRVWPREHAPRRIGRP
jgi:hypothetical protein